MRIEAEERLGDVRHRDVRVEVVGEGVVHRYGLPVDGPGHRVDLAAAAAGRCRSAATPAATGCEQPGEPERTRCSAAPDDHLPTSQ